MALILCGIGTSVTAGTHNSPGNDLVTVLAGVLGMTPLNKGVPNDTTRLMLARFQADVTAPMVLIESAAVNDIPAGITATEHKQNLEYMINIASTSGIRPVMMTQNMVASSTWINAMDAYRDAELELVGKYNIALLDWYVACIYKAWFIGDRNYDAQYIADYQHPNDANINEILAPLARKLLTSS